MKRRTFLKITGVAAGSLVVNPLLAAEKLGQWSDYPNFDPNSPYEGHICCTDRLTGFADPIFDEAKELLDEQIAEEIPPRYRKKISYCIINPPRPGGADPYKQCGYITWKYVPGEKPKNIIAAVG